MPAPPPSSCAPPASSIRPIRVSFKGQEVSGLSIMGLMMLAAGIGSEIELFCSGRQAAEAMAALSALVESKFGED